MGLGLGLALSPTIKEGVGVDPDAIEWEGDEAGNYWTLEGDEAGYALLEGDEAQP